MKSSEFFNKLSNLVLVSDDYSRDWARSPRLRRSWHRLFSCFIVVIIANLLVALTPLASHLETVNGGVFWFRVVSSLSLAVIILLEIRLTVEYFKYTIEGGRPIQLGAVSWLYSMSITLFGLLYFFMHLVEPSNFAVHPDHIKWTAEIGTGYSWFTKLHFAAYSALDSVGVKYPYISSGSLLVSITSYVQKLYTFSLVALFVAGYVNQRAKIESKG